MGIFALNSSQNKEVGPAGLEPRGMPPQYQRLDLIKSLQDLIARKV